MDYKQPDQQQQEKPTGEVALEQEEALQEPLSSFPQDAPNLVPFFMRSEEGQELLAKLAKQVCEDFDTDWENSAEYREQRKANFQMLTGQRKKKTKPFDGCANAHTPLMLERASRLTATVFVEIYLDRETIFAVPPTGPDDYETAELLTIHGNWQIKNVLTDFLRQQQRAIQEFFLTGSCFAHSWYDPIKRRNRHDVLTCDEFVIPFVWTTVETDMSDVPRKTRILRKYRHELEAMRDTDNEYSRWENVDAVLAKDPPAWDSEPDGVAREAGAKYEGIRAPERLKTAPYKLLEQHTWARLPGSSSQRPICITVDHQTKAVLKLYIREEEDWRDRARFDAQMEDAQTYQSDMQAFQDMQAQQQQLQQSLAMDPMADPEETAMVSDAIAQEPLQPPVMPAWMEKSPQPAPVRRVPIEQFSHGVCFENPFGSMGLSFGTVLAELNRLADESYNRFYDAATLANCYALLTTEEVDFGATNIPFGPGKVNKLKGVSDLGKAVRELKPAPANPQLMDVVRFAHENADSAVAAPGVLSGEPGKSGETFRGIATRVERATRQLSNAGLRYLDFVGNILKNNARLNALFMDDEEIVQVLDHYSDIRRATVDPMTGVPMPEVRISRDMYRRNYSVSFTADVRFSSQAQRVSEADEVVGLITSLPPLQSNGALIYAAVSQALRARGKHDLIPLLGPPPPVPDVPLGMPPPMPPPGMEGAPPEEEGGPPPGMPMPEAAPGPIQGPKPEGEV